MTNAEWMIKNGYKFSDVRCCYVGRDGAHAVNLSLNGKILGKVLSVSYYAALKEWLDMDHKEQILDEAERRYLSAVIGPFRNSVSGICKVCSAYEDREYIAVLGFFNGSNCSFLPDFEPGTMFKGMDADKWYSLEELGL